MKKTILIAAVLTSLVGCASNQAVYVDPNNDTAGTVLGLEYRDFEKAASDAVESMIQDGALNNPKGDTYVLAISDIKNDTMQRIDTDQLIKKIRVDLLRSRKVQVTNAIGSTDAMVMNSRSARGNEEFKQSTTQQTGNLIAPDISLSGKMLQRNIALPKRKQQAEYFFQLTLTDLTTGLSLWENETPIIKRGSGKTVAW